MLSSIDMTFEKLMIAEDNAINIETFRFETLDFFFGMARRTTIPEAA
jgi:hypothetical protein